MQTNCKIMIRGKGSVKDGKVSDAMVVGLKINFFLIVKKPNVVMFWSCYKLELQDTTNLKSLVVNDFSFQVDCKPFRS